MIFNHGRFLFIKSGKSEGYLVFALRCVKPATRIFSNCGSCCGTHSDKSAIWPLLHTHDWLMTEEKEYQTPPTQWARPTMLSWTPRKVIKWPRTEQRCKYGDQKLKNQKSSKHETTVYNSNFFWRFLSEPSLNGMLTGAGFHVELVKMWQSCKSWEDIQFQTQDIFLLVQHHLGLLGVGWGVIRYGLTLIPAS